MTIVFAQNFGKTTQEYLDKSRQLALISSKLSPT